MTQDERLMAYVDGELADAERLAFERQLAADPALSAEVEQHRRLRSLIGGAYQPVLDEEVPAQLVAAASVANDPPSRRFIVPKWAAMAACLVAGALVGRVVAPDQGALVLDQGRLTARGDLARALDRRLAADAGEITMGISFRAKDGRFCRTFASTPDQLAGLACRERDGWVVQATSAWSPSAASYRTASSEIPAGVLAAVDELIDGEALDAAAERSALDQSWMPTN